ncbi:unnamed protein product [Prunus brigantina]
MLSSRQCEVALKVILPKPEESTKDQVKVSRPRSSRRNVITSHAKNYSPHVCDADKKFSWFSWILPEICGGFIKHRNSVDLVDQERSERCYMYGKWFNVYSDHKGLKYIFTQHDMNLIERRWMKYMKHYDFELLLFSEAKGFDKVLDVICSLGSFDQHVIYVDLHSLTDMLLKNLVHQPLEGCFGMTFCATNSMQWPLSPALRGAFLGLAVDHFMFVCLMKDTVLVGIPLIKTPFKGGGLLSKGLSFTWARI